jgi:hypothetical protein
MVDVKQRADADWGLVGAVVDGEVAELGFAVAARDALVLRLQRPRDNPAVGVENLQVVIPVQVGHDEVHPQRAERDPLAFDDEAGLLLHVDTFLGEIRGSDPG